MPQGLQRKQVPPRGRAGAESVSALAERALRVMADRRQRRHDSMSDEIAGSLYLALRDADPGARDVWLDRALATGISAEAICDHYIPEVAHRMGQAWNDDTMSFAEVTIGVARMQAMLRDISDVDADSTPRTHQDAASVVVMVLADMYHTLGAMVLTGQLRRLGVSVRLVLGRPAAEISALLRDGTFDAVLISVPLKEDFSDVRDMIAILRGAATRHCPMIVGGGIMQSAVDVCGVTGADHATSDLQDVLQICVRTLSEAGR